MELGASDHSVELSSLGMLVDVDGVLTDRDARPDLGAIGFLADLVRRGARVALVTGRSRFWLEERVLPHVRDCLSHGDEDADLICAAEYGALRTRGLRAPWARDDTFAVPADLRDELRSLTISIDRAPFIEWDASKECMATVEARHGSSDDDQHRERTRAALREYGRDAQQLAVPRGLHVQAATYAVDVAPSGLTKQVGATWALEEFARADARIAATWILGDSKGDLDMASAARDRGMAGVTFVWLGEGAIVELPGAAIIEPQARFGAGTREVLARLLGT